LATVRYWKESQMGILGTNGYLCWVFTFSCIQCWIDFESLPQFHVGYDDDFTTVPYLCTATVPPHWAELVRASSTFALYTESEVGKWQSCPELDIDPEDFALDTANVDTASSTTSTHYCEGDEGHSEGASDVVSHHKNTNTK
jgi:hypothetical protein